MNKIKQILFEDSTNSREMNETGIGLMICTILSIILGVIFWDKLHIYG